MYYNGYIRLYTVTVATLFLLSPLLALPYILLEYIGKSVARTFSLPYS